VLSGSTDHNAANPNFAPGSSLGFRKQSRFGSDSGLPGSEITAKLNLKGIRMGKCLCLCVISVG
jgi:hypothetical protein